MGAPSDQQALLQAAMLGLLNAAGSRFARPRATICGHRAKKSCHAMEVEPQGSPRHHFGKHTSRLGSFWLQPGVESNLGRCCVGSGCWSQATPWRATGLYEAARHGHQGSPG